MFKSFLKKISVGIVILSFTGVAAAYTTKIENKTGKYITHGKVSLAWCSSDSFNIDPSKTWKRGRGGCLLTEINAKVCPEDRSLPCENAKSYTSSGTAYEKFVIKEDEDGGYIITRP